VVQVAGRQEQMLLDLKRSGNIGGTPVEWVTTMASPAPNKGYRLGGDPPESKPRAAEAKWDRIAYPEPKHEKGPMDLNES